ncbi:LysR family transcriptional regulator [Priestia flexa]|uniref:LysR family transcriptional regulator n=1 Tax=Priestia flexa TaxID=86664 RepID=UPI002E1EFE98|nr:LysR family transcriptional regulator [Priestia flexa]
MESNDLKIFKEVAENKSISKAAEQLGYVQPNVSQRIKVLENELEVSLFKRTNRGVKLTKEGEILIDYTNRILTLMNEVKDTLASEKSEKTLTIGASQTVSAGKIPQLITDFLENYSTVLIKVKTAQEQVLMKWLESGDIDGMFISGKYEPTAFQKVYTYFESIAIVSFDKNVHQSKALIVNSDLNCVYRKKLLAYAKKHNQENKKIIEFDSLEAVMQAVQNGLGISALPLSLANTRKNECFHIQQLVEGLIEIHFIVRGEHEKSKGLKTFSGFLRNET